jgi:hypothetical protein
MNPNWHDYAIFPLFFANHVALLATLSQLNPTIIKPDPSIPIALLFFKVISEYLASKKSNPAVESFYVILAKILTPITTLF